MARKVETPEEVDARLKKATEAAEKAATLPGYAFIDVSHGPYAGRRLQVPEAEASSAISEGWARKIGAEPDDEELTTEENLELSEKATKAAKRLRGEKDDDNGDEDKRAKRAKTERNVEPREHEREEGYETRDVKSRK